MVEIRRILLLKQQMWNSNLALFSALTVEQYQRLIQFLGTENSTKIMTPAANMAGKLDLAKTWVVDLGATEHITSDSTVLEAERKDDVNWLPSQNSQ